MTRVLLDENLDHGLRKLLSQFEVSTVRYMGWAGLKNGALLRAIEETNIDVLITGDQTLRYEQNLRQLRFAVISLSAVQLPIIRNHIAALTVAIESAAPGSFQIVDCGTFSRRKTNG